MHPMERVLEYNNSMSQEIFHIEVLGRLALAQSEGEGGVESSEMADDGETIDAEVVFGACNDLAIEGTFLDELLRGTHACTHTHTCNPPGPSNTPHTHTCVHTHTHLFAQQEQQYEASSETLRDADAQFVNDASEEAAMDVSSFLKKTPAGNREAVKKYREKKKAHTAFLEEQVEQLRSLNQQLLRRLQGQSALEAEVYRLRTLLAEFRGRIDGELRFPQQKDPRVLLPGYVLNSYSVPCGGGVDIPCLHPSLDKDSVSATAHDMSMAGLSTFSCEKVSTRCGKKQGSRKRQFGKRSSVVVDMPDDVAEA